MVMPSKLTGQQVREIMKLRALGHSQRELAGRYNVHNTTVMQFERMAQKHGVDFAANNADKRYIANRFQEKPESAFIPPELPSERLDVKDILKAAEVDFERIERARDSRKMIRKDVSFSGPYGVAMFGDIHIENKGCDIPLLRRHLGLVQEHGDIIYKACVGDFWDNWDDKKARLYAYQRRDMGEALALLEWVLGAFQWDLLVKGNHDHWNSLGGNAVNLVHKYVGSGLLLEHDARVALDSTENSITIHMRHNFRGKSQYNPTHGMVRETLWNYRDDLLVCGDWHHAGHMPIWHNQGADVDGGPLMCHAVRLGTYKKFDDYADEKGYKEENWAPAMFAIVDPFTENRTMKVQVVYDIERGIKQLLQLRADYEQQGRL